jgi:HAD superfamily hydrolase (TIGR01509 family)
LLQPHSETTFAKESRRPIYFLYVAGQLHVKPNACIVVEDSPVGVAARIAAGMTAVGGSHASS